MINRYAENKRRDIYYHLLRQKSKQITFSESECLFPDCQDVFAALVNDNILEVREGAGEWVYRIADDGIGWS